MDVLQVFCKLLIYLKEFEPGPIQTAHFLAHLTMRDVTEFEAKKLLSGTVHNKNYMRKHSKKIAEGLLSLEKTPRYVSEVLQIGINTVYYHKRNPSRAVFKCPMLDEIAKSPMRDLLYTQKLGNGDYDGRYDRPVYDRFLVVDYSLTSQYGDSEN